MENFRESLSHYAWSDSTCKLVQDLDSWWAASLALCGWKKKVLVVGFAEAWLVARTNQNVYTRKWLTRRFLKLNTDAGKVRLWVTEWQKICLQMLLEDNYWDRRHRTTIFHSHSQFWKLSKTIITGPHRSPTERRRPTETMINQTSGGREAKCEIAAPTVEQEIQITAKQRIL